MSTQYDYINQYKKYVYIVIGVSLLMLMSVFLISDVNALPLEDVIKKNDGITYNNYTTINNTYTNTTDVINESYIYGPGRPGGQSLTGSTTSAGKFYLKGSSSNNGDIILNEKGGNVGINVSSAMYPLDINQYNIAARFGGTGSTSSITVGCNSYFGGYQPTTTTPTAYMASNAYYTGVWNKYNSAARGSVIILQSGETYFYGAPTTNALGTLFAYLTYQGRFTIGGSSPTALFDDYGTARIRSLGAGTVTSDSGGNLTTVSDEKFKVNVVPLKTNNKVLTKTAIKKIMDLVPVCWNYNAASGLDTNNKYCGFTAQGVESAGILEAVYTKNDVKYETIMEKTKDGDKPKTIEAELGTQTKSIDDRALIATITLALQEEDTKVESMKLEIELLNERIKKLEADKV